MHLYSGNPDCIIVDDGAQPPHAGAAGDPPVFLGRVYAMDFTDAQMEQIQAQLAGQRYATVPAPSVARLVSLLKQSLQPAA